MTISKVLLVLLPCASMAAQGLTLIAPGKPPLAIIHGDGDEYAGHKLADEFRKDTTRIVLLRAGEAVPPVSARIYVGTLRSNPALAAVVSSLGWKADIERLPAEAYLLRTGQKGGPVVVLAGGDRTGAIYAASDLKNFYLKRSGSTVGVDTLDYTEIPKMRYRWFWNWDTRTNWDLLDHDAVYDAVTRLPRSDSVRMWSKRPEAYLRNMQLVIDYMSEHKLNGLILWGFLRDNHGGIEAAQAVCRYANERGVKIIPGAGIDRHYGGFYHEGKHEFNLETRAEQHPELRSVSKSGAYEPRTLCMELPENRDWVRRGLRWLYQTFPIGGVNVEFAEAATCYNEACVRARREQAGGESDFARDLARIVPFVMREAHAVAPDSAISYVTYGGFLPEMQAAPPLHIRVAPEFAICQWTLTNMLTDLVPPRSRTASTWAEGLGPSPWPEGLRPPGRNYIGYIHWNAYYTGNQKGFFVDAYREAARRAYRHGFQGLDTYGEESAGFPNTELSYLAFAEFTFNPAMTEEEFLKKRVAPLYGGEEAGRLALEIARRVGPVHITRLPANVDDLLELAYRGRRAAADRAKARWDRMIHFLRDILPA